MYTLKENRGKPGRKTIPSFLWFKKPVQKTLKSENSQDYAQKPGHNLQKPQHNCMFMNSASG